MNLKEQIYAVNEAEPAPTDEEIREKFAASLGEQTTEAMPSLYALSVDLQNLERNLQHLTVSAINSDNKLAAPLQTQLQNVRRMRACLSDSRLTLEVEADRIISKFEDLQVDLAKQSSDLYAFKNRLRT